MFRKPVLMRLKNIRIPRVTPYGGGGQVECGAARVVVAAVEIHRYGPAPVTVAGSMLPFILRAIGVPPASALAPFVAMLVDVTALVIYFSIASVILRGAYKESRDVYPFGRPGRRV